MYVKAKCKPQLSRVGNKSNKVLVIVAVKPKFR